MTDRVVYTTTSKTHQEIWLRTKEAGEHVNVLEVNLRNQSPVQRVGAHARIVT
jgi:hypothetical protein